MSRAPHYIFNGTILTDSITLSFISVTRLSENLGSRVGLIVTSDMCYSKSEVHFSKCMIMGGPVIFCSPCDRVGGRELRPSTVDIGPHTKWLPFCAECLVRDALEGCDFGNRWGDTWQER